LPVGIQVNGHFDCSLATDHTVNTAMPFCGAARGPGTWSAVCIGSQDLNSPANSFRSSSPPAKQIANRRLYLLQAAKPACSRRERFSRGNVAITREPRESAAGARIIAPAQQRGVARIERDLIGSRLPIYWFTH